MVTVETGQRSGLVWVGSEWSLPFDIKQISRTQFSITVRNTTRAGRHLLMAECAGDRTSIHLDVEPAYGLIQVRIEPSSIKFHYVGEQCPITVLAGSSPIAQDLTHSQSITYVISNNQVAKVDREGMLTALGPGRAILYARPYAGAMQIDVAHSTRGDLNADGRVDIYDLHILETSLSAYLDGWATPNCPNDARDLNGDGRIDIRDANILRSIFTKPGGTS